MLLRNPAAKTSKVSSPIKTPPRVRYEKVWILLLSDGLIHWWPLFFRYINIHSYTSLGEQSTPVTHQFYDAFAPRGRISCGVDRMMNFVTVFRGQHFGPFVSLVFLMKKWQESLNMLKKKWYSKVLDTEFPKRFADSINTSETFWSQELLVLMKILWGLPKTPSSQWVNTLNLFYEGNPFSTFTTTQPPSHSNCDDLGLFWWTDHER